MMTPCPCTCGKTGRRPEPSLLTQGLLHLHVTNAMSYMIFCPLVPLWNFECCLTTCLVDLGACTALPLRNSGKFLRCSTIQRLTSTNSSGLSPTWRDICALHLWNLPKWCLVSSKSSSSLKRTTVFLTTTNAGLALLAFCLCICHFSRSQHRQYAQNKCNG